MGFSWGFREGKTPLLEQLRSVSMMLSGRTSRVIEDCQYFGIIYLSKNTCLLCFPPEVCWLFFSTESALRVLMLLASLSVKIISLCFVLFCLYPNLDWCVIFRVQLFTRNWTSSLFVSWTDHPNGNGWNGNKSDFFLPSSSTSHFLMVKIDDANKVEFMF